MNIIFQNHKKLRESSNENLVTRYKKTIFSEKFRKFVKTFHREGKLEKMSFKNGKFPHKIVFGTLYKIWLPITNRAY